MHQYIALDPLPVCAFKQLGDQTGYPFVNLSLQSTHFEVVPLDLVEVADYHTFHKASPTDGVLRSGHSEKRRIHAPADIIHEAMPSCFCIFHDAVT